MARRTRTRTAWWRNRTLLRWGLLTVLAGAAFSGVLLFVAWHRVCANGACPSIAGLADYDPEQASKVYAADGRLIKDLGEERRTVISLDQMSPAVAAAFLSVEDKRFYRHHGIDWVRFVGALRTVALAAVGIGRVQGFSTITMQLAGNLFPEQINRGDRQGLRGIARKLREARVAREIERTYSKDRILELYLNQIELGNRAFGVEAASLRYFGKSARQVNVAEAAMLAALAKGPTLYNPRRNPRFAMQRRNLVINLMRKAGRLSPVSAEAWKAYPVALASRSDFSGVGEYFVEYVRQLLRPRFGADLYRGGYRIYTTIDLDMQQAAERALDAQLQAIENGALGRFPHPTYREILAQQNREIEADTSPYLQGLMLTLEARTGQIRAMVGGRDWEGSKFNRVTQALRQPGSTFKPFVYSANLRAGYPLSEILDDAPISLPMPEGQEPWEPQNFDNRFLGPMTLRQGLFNSRNTIAVRAGLQVGVDAVLAEASQFGISTRIDPVPSIFIGAATLSPLELIGAYTAFANLGVRTEPVAILRVEDRSGAIVWEPESRAVTVMDSVQAWLMLDVLRDVVRRGTAYSAVTARGFPHPAGGKTGTTNDGFDVWFVGFTADLVTGVWMGYDLPRKIMPNAQGGRLAAPAWTAMMREVYERRAAPLEWVMPEGVSTLMIDESTGEVATPFCPLALVRREFFIPGTEPGVPCRRHSPFSFGPRPSDSTHGGTGGGRH